MPAAPIEGENMLERFVDIIFKQRILILFLTLLIIGVGIYSWQTLDIDAFPDVTNVQVMVLTESPGLAAVDVEQQITYPIEWQMSGLPYVRLIRSLSKSGLSQVVIVFEDFVDIYFARQVVHERLQMAKESLPEGVHPELGPISTGLGEIYQYTLESNEKDLMALRTIQDWLVAPQLRSIPGVTEVNSFGGFVKQYQIEVSPEKLIKFGLSLRDILDSIQKNNANAPGGFIVKGWEQSSVRSIGLIGNISDIENIVLKSEQGTPVLLKDIADIKVGGETRQGAVTRDGKGETVAGMVIMLKGANSRNLVQKVKAKIPQIQAMLDKEGISINTFYDRTSLIQACVQTMSNALFMGGFLVIIIVFFFLWNFRAGLITTLSLPLCAALTFIAMKWMGISANLMSLGGLAISIGMIVDSSIVVTENTVRHLSSENTAKDPLTFIVARSTKEVIKPIFFAILIIIIVFLPLFTLEQTEGKMFRPLALTICLAMLASLIVGLISVPVLCSLFLKRNENDREGFFIRNLKKLYQPLLLAAMRHRIVIVLVAVGLFLLSVLMAFRLGTEFIPTLDEGSIAVNVVRLPSASLEGSKIVVQEIERQIMKIPEVKTVVSKTGRAEISEDPMGPEQNDIFIMLKNNGEWRSGIRKDDLIEEISAILSQIPGIRPSFSQPIALRVNELISGVKSDLAIKIFGDDLDILRENGVKISQVLAGMRGVSDVKLEQVSGYSHVNVKIDRTEIARHEINVSDVNDTIETAVGGKITSWLIEGRERFAILVRFPYEKRKDISALENILIPSSKGYQVPLKQLANIGEIEGPAQISHEKSMRRIVVECNIRDRDTGSFVKEVQQKIKGVEQALPAGYFIEFGGQFENQQRAQKRLMLIVPLSVLLILLLLYASFGSFKPALLVILNVPFALIGGVFSLYVSNQYLSVSSSVGFIALFGIAVLNGVLLVSFFRNLREGGLPLEEAIIQGSVLRLRPVLMTALTTAFGFIPLILSMGSGSEIQRPLATVVIGGLITSTCLTLLVLPAIYPWFQGKEGKS